MTTKVVKGSMWTLAGSVLPLAVTFVSTPFIIRFLGAEAYGVLLLVALIPTYFNFADFGMGIASTRFASEAYGQGNEAKESQIVWTAAAIALVASLTVAVPIFFLSGEIVGHLNIAEHLSLEASIALKVTSAAFVVGILSGVLNSPMLARLRMDLNTFTSAAPKVILAIGTPLVLYLGGGILGAVSLAFLVGFVALVAVVCFSGSLLPTLFGPMFRREHVGSLLKFGGAWLLAMMAGMLLVNFDKLALARMVSVKALAYYSVAFTFASMATTFSSAMLQSLVPAFSQLLAPERKDEFDALFARGLRLNLILLLPGIAFMAVIAKPFFTFWAGEEFGVESTLPLYILLVGFFFSVLSYIPHSTITAKGRTDIFAKIFWVELPLYVLLVYLLIGKFGIAGAAAAWSLRVLIEAFVIVWFSRQIAQASFGLGRYWQSLILAVVVLVPPVFVATFYNNFSRWLILIAPVSAAVYGLIVWTKLVDADEKKWIKNGSRFAITKLKQISS